MVGEGLTQRQAIARLKDSLRRYVEIVGIDETRTLMKHSLFKVRKLKWDLSDLSSGKDDLSRGHHPSTALERSTLLPTTD